MENLILTQTIDRYLAGTMSADERQEFESKLKTDSALQKEVDIQREIIKQVRLKAMRGKVNKYEDGERIKNVKRWALRVLSPIAVAACVAGIVVVPQMQMVAKISNDTALYASVSAEMQLAYQDVRGAGKASDIILCATELMDENDFKQADKLLKEGLLSLENETRENIQAWQAKEDMLYMRALCSIKQGRVYRTRYLLSEVISMDATHKQEAQRLLNEIKGK